MELLDFLWFEAALSGSYRLFYLRYQYFGNKELKATH